VGEVTLLERAKKIPSLGGGGATIWAELIDLAGKVNPDEAIVEVGPFLGSATAFMACGARRENGGPEIHCYDPWETDDYIRKAEKLGIRLEPGQDMLPLFLKNLEQFGANLVPHKMSFMASSWGGRKIGLFVCDAGAPRELLEHMEKVFEPYFIPNHTSVLLMDYYFYETHSDPVYAEHRDYMRARGSDYVQYAKKARTAFFRYQGCGVKKEDDLRSPSGDRRRAPRGTAESD